MLKARFCHKAQIQQSPTFDCEACVLWCPDSESNQGHEDFQSSALPTELSGHLKEVRIQSFSDIFIKYILCFSKEFS